MTGRAPATKQRFVPFGRYLLLELIAMGGMAEVFLAKRFTDDEVSDLIAVKRIRPALARNDAFIRMFLDEARIAARLDHPGIVSTLELGRIGQSHYLAMDYVWGKDLLNVMRRVKLLGAQLSSSWVAWVGMGMCEALHHAHELTDRHGTSMALIHRDVSPQNVLVSFDGVVKLIDFGIAKANARSTQTQAGVLKGKVGYMSPEQVAGAKIDRRSDLFAVGTCLYELLTLRTLFARENAFEAMENVRYVRAAPIQESRPDLPDALVAILKRAHAADPAERWQTAREMSQALRGYLSDHDPNFDRESAVGWMRDAFRKEFHEERGRLDAFDQIGRPQVVRAEPTHRNSVTELQIERAKDPEAPKWDETGETVLSDDEYERGAERPEPSRAAEDEGPTEIFFRQGDLSEPGLASANADPFQADGSVDVSLDPSQIDSGIMERLLPVQDQESPEDKAAVAREPTQRTRASDVTIDPPRRRPASTGDWLARIGVATVLLCLGAAAVYGYTLSSETSSIEVRTTPEVAGIVLLDGVQHGTTPTSIEDVAEGTHELTVIAVGFEDSHQDVHVTESSSVMVEVQLTPVAPP